MYHKAHIIIAVFAMIAVLFAPAIVVGSEEEEVRGEGADVALVDVALTPGTGISWTIVHDGDEDINVDVMVWHEWIDRDGYIIGRARAIRVQGFLDAEDGFTFDSTDRTFGRAATRLQKFIASPPEGAFALRVTIDAEDADETNNVFEVAVQETFDEEFVFAD